MTDDLIQSALDEKRDPRQQSDGSARDIAAYEMLYSILAEPADEFAMRDDFTDVMTARLAHLPPVRGISYWVESIGVWAVSITAVIVATAAMIVAWSIVEADVTRAFAGVPLGLMLCGSVVAVAGLLTERRVRQLNSVSYVTRIS